MQRNSNIKALIHLMDDPDTSVYKHVRDQLMQYGPEAIPFLENSWSDENFGNEFLERVENLIHDIQFQTICEQLQEWKNGSRDLLEGAILIAKYQYPGLNEEHIYDFLNHLTREIWLEINYKLTAFEKIKVINQVFYREYQFRGDSKNYNSPLNSYINTVIELRKGNPLTLSIIYSVLAQKLDLPVYGVNLPSHFILAYLDKEETHRQTGLIENHGVLFYINTFSQGGILTHQEIKEYLKQINIESHRAYLEPCSNTTILTRMLTNLISGYQQEGKKEKQNELSLLRNILM